MGIFTFWYAQCGHATCAGIHKTEANDATEKEKYCLPTCFLEFPLYSFSRKAIPKCNARSHTLTFSKLSWAEAHMAFFAFVAVAAAATPPATATATSVLK